MIFALGDEQASRPGADSVNKTSVTAGSAKKVDGGGLFDADSSGSDSGAAAKPTVKTLTHSVLEPRLKYSNSPPRSQPACSMTTTAATSLQLRRRP